MEHCKKKCKRKAKYQDKVADGNKSLVTFCPFNKNSRSYRKAVLAPLKVMCYSKLLTIGEHNVPESLLKGSSLDEFYHQVFDIEKISNLFIGWDHYKWDKWEYRSPISKRQKALLSSNICYSYYLASNKNKWNYDNKMPDPETLDGFIAYCLDTGLDLYWRHE